RKPGRPGIVDRKAPHGALQTALGEPPVHAARAMARTPVATSACPAARYQLARSPRHRYARNMGPPVSSECATGVFGLPSGRIPNATPRKERRMRPRRFSPMLVLLLAGCAAKTPIPSATRDPMKAQITILYNAFGRPSAMEKDWGFAALIEYGGKRVLFDTGDNPDIFARNVKAKAADLSNLDFV